MTTKTDGGAAFPYPSPRSEKQIHGMSLRDFFAAKAMQALISQSMGSALQSDLNTGAQYAYRMADAMLAARENKS